MMDFETPSIDFSNRDRALQQIWSYVQSFQEQVSFWLRNLDKDSFNEQGLKEITEPITAQIQDVAGDVTTLQATAEGLQSSVADAEGKASSAQQTADGVKVEVDGLKSRNTVTIDSTGLYVTNAAGQTTKLSGNQITSGTIEGVTLISKGTGATITISNGKITFSSGGGAASLTQTSRSGLYIEAGSVSGEGISISTDSFFLSANGGTSISGPTSIEGDLTVAKNINSNGIMKLSAGGNMSIDASSSIFIGGSNSGETVQIGTSGATINLIGDVTLNGKPLTAATTA
jgi:hypothetical protein